MRCLPAAFVHSLTGGHQHPSIKSWRSSTTHRPIKNQKRLVRPVRVYAETCEKRVHEYVGNSNVCQHLRVQVYRKLAAASTHAPAPRQKRIPVVYTKASLGHIRTNLMCASFVGDSWEQAQARSLTCPDTLTLRSNGSDAGRGQPRAFQALKIQKCSE